MGETVWLEELERCLFLPATLLSLPDLEVGAVALLSCCPLPLPCLPPRLQLLDCVPAPLVVPALLVLLRAPFTRSQLLGRAASSADAGFDAAAPPLEAVSRAISLDHLNKQLILSVSLFRRSQVGVLWRGGPCADAPQALHGDPPAPAPAPAPGSCCCLDRTQL